MDSLEALIKAKIPGPETGIEKKNTVCAICSPAYNCGVCAYVKDGKMVKLEGLDEHPRNKGCLRELPRPVFRTLPRYTPKQIQESIPCPSVQKNAIATAIHIAKRRKASPPFTVLELFQSGCFL